MPIRILLAATIIGAVPSAPAASPLASVVVRSQPVQEEEEATRRRLRDKDPDVVKEAVERLSREATLRDTGLIPELIAVARRNLPRDSSFIAHDAGRALGRLGPEAVTELVKVFAGGSLAAREWAVTALGGSSSPVAPSMGRFLAPTQPQPTRCYALTVLGQRGPEAACLLSEIILCLDDSSAETRIIAVSVLGAIGPDAAPASERLATMLQGEDTYLCASAAGALGGIGPAAVHAMPALRSLLSSSHEHVASSAAFAMLRIEPESRAEVLALLDTSPRDGSGILVALGNAYASADVVPPEIVDRLALGVQASSSLEREASAKAIGSIGHAASAAVPALLKQWSKEDDSRSRIFIVKALAQVGGRDAEVRRRLAEMIAADDVIAISALREVASPEEFIDALRPAVMSKDKWIRVVAVVEIEKMEPTPSMLELLTVAAHDQDMDVRGVAARALASDGPLAEERVAVLVPMLDDPEEEVRIETIRALGRLGPAARPACERLEVISANARAMERTWAERALRRIAEP